MNLAINHWIKIDKQKIEKDGHRVLSATTNELSPESIYGQLQSKYPKFYKMDILSKWAWLGAEALLRDNHSDTSLYSHLDPKNIGIVLFTSQGCLDADKRYSATLETIPSPALFVYTLPNIMLGEICIRHGFKGEQICLVSERPDMNELYFSVDQLLTKQGMDACLCGWVDATEDNRKVFLCWVTKHSKGVPFTTAALQEIYIG